MGHKAQWRPPSTKFAWRRCARRPSASPPGTGHDAGNLALVAPTAMTFVPCAGGISHNEAENARPEDLGERLSQSPL